jgi:hypothetical protein
MAVAAAWPAVIHAQEFVSAWPSDVTRPWVGPEYWANRLQDWRISGGRLECLSGSVKKPLRTVHLLTRRLNAREGAFGLQVRTGIVKGVSQDSPDASAGFLLGAGPGLDYRAAALIHHSTGAGAGLIAAVDGAGRAVFRDMTKPNCPVIIAGTPPVNVPREIALNLQARQSGTLCNLLLHVRDAKSGEIISYIALDDVPAAQLSGNIALVSHPGISDAGARFWFRDLRVTGSKIDVFDQDRCGPIIATQYTLSRGVLKLTAQLMPIGEKDAHEAKLDVEENEVWRTVATAPVNPSSYTAAFRIEQWNNAAKARYRVVYDLRQGDRAPEPQVWYGEVRREPLDQDTLVVAAFTGNHNVRPGGVDGGKFDWNISGLWFPHTDLVGRVTPQNPDLVFFSGDQVYEGASPTVPERTELDYLYKWYLWCWAYRDLAKDRPCICLPDDHDVYQGNLWGAGGRKAEKQDDGGYTLPAAFVNMIQQTQTSHLPDPFDPIPAEQGIGVYYGSMNYGGISFAILEDRKFKSSPTVMVPEGKCENGWFQNPDFDPATQADVSGAVLLGERQQDYLEYWAADWRGGVKMKAVLSQTMFADVATLPADARSDKVVPKLEIPPPGEYPEYYALLADADTNGWPQSGRNAALRAWRKGFAFHICGDQHLGSTVHYGVDTWNDAGYVLCVPSIANFFPRRWYPPLPGANQKPGAPRYTGEYRDAFGNCITVHAVANPEAAGREPAALHDRAPGYGLARFNKAKRTITIECWPRWENPNQPNARQYPGWPITITQEDNYGRAAEAYLPTLEVTGLTDPVVQVIDESDGSLVYALRIAGTTYRPKVFKSGAYTVKVGDPDTGKEQTLTNVQSLPPDQQSVVQVAL